MKELVLWFDRHERAAKKLISWFNRHERIMGWLISFVMESITAYAYVLFVLVTLAFGRSFPSTFVGDEPLSFNAIVTGTFLAWWIVRLAFAPGPWFTQKKEKRL